MNCPNDIEILIHFHCSGAPHPREDAPAVQEAIARFTEDGIFAFDDQLGRLTTTPMGAAWLRAICSVPYPTPGWLDEKGRPI